MGARTTWIIKSSDEHAIHLYGHWAGEFKILRTQRALAYARSRWEDETYCARIFMSQLIEDEWDRETGWGVMAGHPDTELFEEEYLPITLDVANRRITVGEHTMGYQEFLDTEATELGGH